MTSDAHIAHRGQVRVAALLDLRLWLCRESNVSREGHSRRTGVLQPWETTPALLDHPDGPLPPPVRQATSQQVSFQRALEICSEAGTACTRDWTVEERPLPKPYAQTCTRQSPRISTIHATAAPQ